MRKKNNQQPLCGTPPYLYGCNVYMEPDVYRAKRAFFVGQKRKKRNDVSKRFSGQASAEFVTRETARPDIFPSLRSRYWQVDDRTRPRLEHSLNKCSQRRCVYRSPSAASSKLRGQFVEASQTENSSVVLHQQHMLHDLKWASRLKCDALPTRKG